MASTGKRAGRTAGTSRGPAALRRRVPLGRTAPLGRPASRAATRPGTRPAPSARAKDIAAARARSTRVRWLALAVIAVVLAITLTPTARSLMRQRAEIAALQDKVAAAAARRRGAPGRAASGGLTRHTSNSRRASGSSSSRWATARTRSSTRRRRTRSCRPRRRSPRPTRAPTRHGTSGCGSPLAWPTSRRRAWRRLPTGDRTCRAVSAGRPRRRSPRQLGRPPRGVHEVAHRCPCGQPDVVRTEPRLPDGTPFPTTYYATCPRLTAAVSTLEGQGLMRRCSERLASDPGLATAYQAAHEDYLARRAELGDGARDRGRLGRRDAHPRQVPARAGALTPWPPARGSTRSATRCSRRCRPGGSRAAAPTTPAPRLPGHE